MSTLKDPAAPVPQYPYPVGPQHRPEDLATRQSRKRTHITHSACSFLGKRLAKHTAQPARAPGALNECRRCPAAQGGPAAAAALGEPGRVDRPPTARYRLRG